MQSPRVLNQDERQFYFDNGYVVKERAIDMAYTLVAYPMSHYNIVVLEEEAKYLRHEPFRIRMPPDWSDGYTWIFQHRIEH